MPNLEDYFFIDQSFKGKRLQIGVADVPIATPEQQIKLRVGEYVPEGKLTCIYPVKVRCYFFLDMFE